MKTPDRWVVIKIGLENPLYKVFATFYGGYSGENKWSLNSGIKEVKVDLENNCIDFIGYSGSIYRCSNNCYGTGMTSQMILNNIIAGVTANNINIEVMPENTDWTNLLNAE